jgi:hypothetical protein
VRSGREWRHCPASEKFLPFSKRPHCGHFRGCHSSSMEQLGFVGCAAAGLWLIATGAFMALRPERALRVLSLTASTRMINNVEQGLRLSAGLALLLRAPAAKLPQTFEVAGCFIVLSSLVLLVIPLRWHAAYACWWADRLAPTVVRAVAPFSALAGLTLLYVAA